MRLRFGNRFDTVLLSLKSRRRPLKLHYRAVDRARTVIERFRFSPAVLQMNLMYTAFHDLCEILDPEPVCVLQLLFHSRGYDLFGLVFGNRIAHDYPRKQINDDAYIHSFSAEFEV